LDFYPGGTLTHCSCQPSLDAHFSVPIRASKVDTDGLVTLEDATVIADGAAPEGLQFTLGLVGEPVFGIATADVVNLFGQVIPSFADDAKDGASELFGLVESRSVGHPASVLPEMTDGPV
jgi:hypothetical protein